MNTTGVVANLRETQMAKECVQPPPAQWGGVL